jgi:hypothetical protein
MLSRARLRAVLNGRLSCDNRYSDYLSFEHSRTFSSFLLHFLFFFLLVIFYLWFGFLLEFPFFADSEWNGKYME